MRIQSRGTNIRYIGLLAIIGCGESFSTIPTEDTTSYDTSHADEASTDAMPEAPEHVRDSTAGMETQSVDAISPSKDAISPSKDALQSVKDAGKASVPDSCSQSSACIEACDNAHNACNEACAADTGIWFATCKQNCNLTWCQCTGAACT